MRRFSILLAASLLLNIFTGLGGMPVAAAGGQATQDVALTFLNSAKVGNKLYSKQSSLTSNAASVTAPAGSKIQKVELYYGGSLKQTLVGGAALPSWSGSATLYGQERGVISSQNESAKGYFAWYRYAKGSKPGDKWYYGGYAGQCPSPSGSSDLDAFGMPATPGCTEAGLTLNGTVLPYHLGDGKGVVIPNSAIVDTPGVVNAVAEVNDVDISGPEGMSSKPYFKTTLTGVTMNSLTSFTVSFKQDFSYLGEAKDLASYGARLNVYFSAWKVDVTSKTYEYDADAKLIVTFVGDVPPTITIDGDFDITPSSTINWRDSFTLKPKDFNISASCTYQYHEFRIARNGSSWGSEKLYGQTTSKSFSYSSYPFVIGVGSHDISIRITTTCGDTGWIKDKTLTVNGPASNNPPIFSVGWTTPGIWSQAGVQTSVVVGTQLDLVYLSTPAAYDPDGDAFSFLGFDFTNQAAWAQAIPGKYASYDNGYQRILMDTPGYYCATGTMRDSFGASAAKQACVQVTEPNPVPVITAPDVIRENHPVLPAIHGNLSYSPVGRTIDHSKDVWTNRKSIYTTPGPQTITLDVFDSAGLKSLAPAVKTIDVLPDEPPVAILDVQPLGIRGEAYDAFNSSYSPDNDKLVSAVYRYRYDKDNNGFDDDAWVNMIGTLIKTTLTPMRVGKYEIELTVTEDYGKSATTTVILDTVNQAPSVSFLIEGENETPQPDNKKIYSSQDILAGWPLYQTNTTTAIADKTMAWSVNNGALDAGIGRLGDSFKGQYVSYTRYNTDYSMLWADPHQNGGLGANTLNAFRAATAIDNAKNQPLLMPTGSNPESLRPVIFNISQSEHFLLRSSPSHIYYSYTVQTKGSYSVYGPSFAAINKSKIGRYQAQTVCNGCVFPTLEHHYLDGSPFDFVLHPSQLTRPKYKRAIFKNYTALALHDYTGASSVYEYYMYDAKVLGYEVSDQTVYQIIQWTAPESVTYWGDEDYYYDFNLVDIRTYDAQTGEFIQSTALSGKDYVTSLGNLYGIRVDKLFTKGDNLVIFDSAARVFEFNRNGDLVKQVTYGKPTNSPPTTETIDGVNKTCTVITNPSNLYRGAGGEWYGWENARCGDNANENYIFIYKLTPDYQIAWRTKLTGHEATDAGSYAVALGSPQDSRYIMLINPIRREVVVRSYTNSGYTTNVYYQAINMDSGVATTYTGPQFTSISPKVSVPWTGVYTEDSAGWTTYTPDGYKTVLTTNNIKVYNAAGQTVTTFSGGGLLELSGPYATTTNTPKGGYYVGDGMYIGFYTKVSSGYEDANNLAPWLMVGTPTTNVQPYQGFKLGQFISTDIIDNSELSWTMKMAQPKANTNLAGMSFRMTDARNRYAVETDGSQLYLAKYVNGSRTVLQQIAFSFLANTAYNFKVGMQGSRLQVFVNGVPYFDKTDTSFASGKFGPFTDKSNVDFSNISRVQLSEPSVEWLTNFSIWDGGSATANVRYSNIVFDDPENDPMAGNYQWTIQHTPKFLNNQGVSTLNGKTLTSPALQFDKVGNYRVTLKAQDDPNASYLFPSSVFAGYRKWSNEFWQIITVHRRPIAQFTLSISPSDKTVVWNDTSYDPDRWQSPTVYDTEATGVNYKTTRGILERKYYYVTPGGTKKDGKLVTPQETGTYTVGLQVKDEFGAWSQWAIRTIAIATAVLPDEPPTPGFTLGKTTLYRGETLSITSTAKDKEDGAAVNLMHEYYVRNKSEGGAESLLGTNRGVWTTSFSSLGVMEIRQVVCDSRSQCAQTVKSATVINRAPLAQFDWAPKPAFEGDAIHLTNQSSDPDGDDLISAWTVVGPDGAAFAGSATDYSLDGGITIGRPGTYRVKLAVKDASGAVSTVSRDVIVHELAIRGEVRHTDDWEANRLRYNDRYPDDSRPSDWFWAGEAFVLIADVTDTGMSSTKPVYVEARAPHKLYKKLDAANTDGIYWQGLLRSADVGFPLYELPQGPLTFTFTVHFSNGVEKTSQVTVQLTDTVDRFVQVHRVQ